MPKFLRDLFAAKGDNRPFFISGPQEFVDLCADTAVEMGVNPSLLRYEPMRPLSPSDQELVSLFGKISPSGHVGSLVTNIDYLALAKEQANNARMEDVVEKPFRLFFFIIVLSAELALSICYFLFFRQAPIFLLGASAVSLVLAIAVRILKDKTFAGHLIVGSYFTILIMPLLLPDYLLLLEPWSLTMPLVASKFVRPRAALWYSLYFILIFGAISIVKDSAAIFAGKQALIVLVQYTVGIALVTALTQFTARRERFYSEAVTKKDEIQKQSLRQMESANRLSQVFTQIFQQTSNHVIFTDRNGRILYANHAAEKLTGYSFNEMFFQTPRLWGGLMGGQFFEDLWKEIGSGEVAVRQVINRHRDGRLYTVLCRITPLVSLRTGSVFAYVSTEEDISELQEIDKAKTEFVSMASHQLQTPLAAINWYSELLNEGDSGRMSLLQKNYIKEISEGSKRMTELVKALLNVARIDLDRFMITPERIDAREILDSAISEQRFAIDEKRQHLEVPAAGERLFLDADPRLMRIIFQNLLSNAVKYTPQGGRISIEMGFLKKKERFGATELPAESFCFSISDTGLGIPDEQQPKIFSKLFRAENARAKVTDGTGLGLYIVKSILIRAGGDIWFKSKENLGTSFYVTIPATGMRKKTGDRTIT